MAAIPAEETRGADLGSTRLLPTSPTASRTPAVLRRGALAAVHSCIALVLFGAALGFFLGFGALVRALFFFPDLLYYV